MMPERMGEKSNFLATCNLLSQYIKQKCSLGELMITPPRLPEPIEALRRPTTLNLLPGVAVAGDDDIETKNATKSMDLFTHQAGFGVSVAEDSSKPFGTREPEKVPLTIFYGGRVIVFDNFPAEKAKDLMEMADKGSSVAASPVMAGAHDSLPKSAQPAASALPLSRRASLSRFLEKRKDRITSKAPYQVTSSPLGPLKSEEPELWLGLGPQAPSKPVSSAESTR